MLLSSTREVSTKKAILGNRLNWLTLPVLALFYIGGTSACTFSAPTVTLPPNSSFNINTQTESSSSIIAMVCNGLISVNLLPAPVLNATVTNTTNNMNLKNPAGDLIPYTIYSDAGYNNPVTTGSVINYGNSNFLSISLLQIKGNLPFYIRTGKNNAINVNVSSGTYTDTINLNWNYDLCATLGISLCALSSFQGTATSTVFVTLKVSNDCVIKTAPDVNFGSYALIAQFVPVQQNISTTCTKNATFTTYITNGNNFATPWPQMKLTSGNDYLQYQLYQGTGKIPWNVTNKRTDTATGTEQFIPYNAVINAQQVQRTVGTYRDDVSVVLEY